MSNFLKPKHYTLLFLRKNNDILLAMKKRGWGSDRFNGVGGKIEPGETIEEALIRECQEEIEVTPTKFWKVAEHDFTNNTDADPYHMFVHVYLCDEWQGTPSESEEMAPQWFKISEIPYDQMWQDDPYWLPQVLDGKKIESKFSFDNDDNMLSHQVSQVSNFTN